ncbi:LuxR C-terminal-related transcriptional regulator [Actinoallomurus sp. CA-150999]|uniref:LuxR C-terminal-related transcriptional regulator n=1 Tax=Actinoallomurus sp. CA-150999 TaxID=3239887 RepID=UPI003D92B470
MVATHGIRVGAIDDHPVTLRGIELLLAEFPEIHVVTTADTPAALLASPEVGRDLDGLDVVLVDLYLATDVPSLDVVQELAPRVPVLVMSASRHRHDVVAAIRAGASGYLTKDSAADQFAAAITTVASGGFFLSSQLADMVGAVLAGRTTEPELSPREEEALGWIARGFTHAQTARRMGVTKATVDTYVERIRRKLQVGNKAELTRAALRRRGRPSV